VSRRFTLPRVSSRRRPDGAPGSYGTWINVQPTPGLSNSEHHIFVVREVARVGKLVGFESERVEWVPLSSVAIGPETP